MVGDFWTLKITVMKLGLREFKKRCIFEKFYFLKAIGYRGLGKCGSRV